MRNRFIFLDVDGVLNSIASCFVKLGTTTSFMVQELEHELRGDLPHGAKYALRCVNPVSVALVNRLIKETDAGLVLSSTHRQHFDHDVAFGSEIHLNRLRRYLFAMGIQVPMFFSITPLLGSRKLEVQFWLEQYGAECDYVILDDDQNFDEHQALVWCDPAHGLSLEGYVTASKKLGAPVSPLML